MSTTSGTVARRPQSRCNSHAKDTQLIGCAPGLDDALEAASMGFERSTAHGVDDWVHLVARSQSVEGREGETDLGPQCRHDEVLAAGSFDRVSELDVFPGIDLG